MKVCTDACVFGAAVPVPALSGAATVLDIGTGTGLLALMLAQRCPAQIDAVEIDQGAYVQAKENVQQSPWAQRINVWHGAVQDFANAGSGRYDLIICNPPFFSQHLQPDQEAKKLALHNDTLPLQALAQAVTQWLQQQGRFFVMLPPYEANQLQEQMQQAGLMPFWQMHLHHNAQSKLLRVMTGYSYQNSGCTTQRLNIYGKDGQYSPPFVALLKPFYLYL